MVVLRIKPAASQPGKRPEKTVDPEGDWVYIDQSQPLKGDLLHHLARPSAFSRIILLSWGSSVDAPVRFEARREWESRAAGSPSWQSVSLLRLKTLFQCARVRQDF
jgi:hypothetical protein